MNNSVAFAKGEPNCQIKDLPDIDQIKSLNETLPLPDLREV